MNALEKYDPKQIQANAPASWGQVKYWAATAAKGAMVSAAAMVMAGFNLLDLHKKVGTNQGKRTDLETTSPHAAEKLNWPELVQSHAGVSDDTAGRWMKTAEGVKAKWKKAPPQERIRELMRLPVADWSAADTDLVFKSLAKSIDGATMVEFMRELGLAKQIPKSTGRDPGCDGTKKKLSLSEEAELRKIQAREDWTATDKMHRAYQEKFLVLTDEEITAQIATLEQALKARQVWLKQPLNKRDPKAIAEMFKAPKETQQKQNFYAYKNKWGSILVHPQDVKDCLEAMKSPSVVGVIRFLDAETLEEANSLAKAMFAKGEFQETFGAKQADAVQVPEATGPVVMAHKPHELPDGNTITVTGFAHARRYKNGKEPFVVVFNDNTAKRRRKEVRCQH